MLAAYRVIAWLVAGEGPAFLRLVDLWTLDFGGFYNAPIMHLSLPLRVYDVYALGAKAIVGRSVGIRGETSEVAGGAFWNFALSFCEICEMEKPRGVAAYSEGHASHWPKNDWFWSRKI